ncbi:MAG: peptide chain release factor N(5)-glutamine methyltransferase, partial [Deltaproteobacteria bacterium]|nr:peptide chain release factor N(5)-glutamine methyltransferase [Deltaproteobacteria bacterium]
HVLKTDRLHLFLRFDQPVQGDELAEYKALIKRRAKLEPVAYILGKKAFFDLDFAVDGSVLVPRPETESLVDLAVAFVDDPAAPAGDVLDLCTGSGCVAIALAHHVRQKSLPRRVLASDVSQAAIDVAQRNAKSTDVSIEFRQGSLWQPFSTTEKFAAIVSNPPYVRSGDIAKLDIDVRQWEPRLALDGGADGSDLLRWIVDRAAEFLVPGGLLAVELGSRAQADALIEYAEKRNLGRGLPQAVLGGPTHTVRWLRPDN